MNFSTVFVRVSLSAATVMTLSACSIFPEPPNFAGIKPSIDKPAVPKLHDMLGKANQAVASGNKEQAVTLWKQGAAAFPADKTPWLNIAQTRHEAGQYSEAIQAATEVLVRDPSDKVANSIIAIGGLRLAIRALGDLSRQNNLSGNIRNESQDLAKLLRESLGEAVLVPPPVAPVIDVREREREVVRARVPSKLSKPIKTGKSEGDANNSANPFNALK